MEDQSLLDQADAQYRTGHYAQAVQTYEAARTLRKDRPYQAFIDLNVAQSLRRQGLLQDARRLAKRGMERLTGIKLIPTHAELLLTFANCEADLGNHVEAISSYDLTYQEFQSLNNKYGIYQTLVGKSRSLMALDRSDEARAVLQTVLSADDVPSLVRSQALTNLAALESGTNPDFARALLQEDLELHGVLDDDYGLAGTLINLAMIEIEQAEKDKAIVLLESAREAASRVNAADMLVRATTLLEDIQQKP
jgi:tetratricopeptide (TPR) repeat protein